MNQEKGSLSLGKASPFSWQEELLALKTCPVRLKIWINAWSVRTKNSMKLSVYLFFKLFGMALDLFEMVF